MKHLNPSKPPCTPAKGRTGAFNGLKRSKVEQSLARESLALRIIGGAVAITLWSTTIAACAADFN